VLEANIRGVIDTEGITVEGGHAQNMVQDITEIANESMSDVAEKEYN